MNPYERSLRASSKLFKELLGWPESKRMTIPGVRIVTAYEYMQGRELPEWSRPGPIPDSASVSCMTDELDDVQGILSTFFHLTLLKPFDHWHY